jgi:hypothetical protein
MRCVEMRPIRCVSAAKPLPRPRSADLPAHRCAPGLLGADSPANRRGSCASEVDSPANPRPLACCGLRRNASPSLGGARRDVAMGTTPACPISSLSSGGYGPMAGLPDLRGNLVARLREFGWHVGVIGRSGPRARRGRGRCGLRGFVDDGLRWGRRCWWRRDRGCGPIRPWDWSGVDLDHLRTRLRSAAAP